MALDINSVYNTYYSYVAVFSYIDCKHIFENQIPTLFAKRSVRKKKKRAIVYIFIMYVCSRVCTTKPRVCKCHVSRLSNSNDSFWLKPSKIFFIILFASVHECVSETHLIARCTECCTTRKVFEFLFYS